MKVKLIAITQPTTEDDFVDSLIEYAGRVCYSSEMAETVEDRERFIRKRIASGHESILEHASASFHISGISRACSHQLVRHRLCSFSQKSQRYTNASADEFVVPASIENNPIAEVEYLDLNRQSRVVYTNLLDLGIPKQDARFVLPSATTTEMVLTANFRELRHIFKLRLSPAAQWEIKDVCKEMLRQVRVYAPVVFEDIKEDQ